MNLGRRPWWMNALLAFCLYMSVVRVPRDLFSTPVANDQEVWFGILLRGTAAKATEPLHWAIYAAGAYGFWKMRAWMHPWAALYVLQIALGTLVWSVSDPLGRGRGLAAGVGGFAAFAALAWQLWRSRAHFGPRVS
jgi:hypothetical protein